MTEQSRQRRCGVLTLVLAFPALACSSDEAPRASVIERDSAGIAITEHPARASTEDVAQLYGIEVVSIGAIEGDAAETFNRIADMATDLDGHLHVLDAGDQLVEVYDSDGSWISRYGGSGEGPAEFQGASLLIPLGDSMGVYDYRNQKIALFGREGSLLATRRWQLPIFEFGFPSELTAIPGGLAGVFQTGCSMPPPEDRRPTWKLLTLGADGSVKDTVAVRFRSDLMPLYGERFCSVIPALAGSGYQVAVRKDGTTAFTAEREYEISLLQLSALEEAGHHGDLPSPERIIRRGLDATMVTTAQIAEYRERYLTTPEDDPIGPDRVEAIKQALDSTDIPESHPQIDALLWDEADRLWVGRAVVDGTANRTWDVYDGVGRLVAEAVLPAELDNVLVTEDMVWGTLRDELDVMYVKGFRLEEREPSGGPDH